MTVGTTADVPRPTVSGLAATGRETTVVSEPATTGPMAAYLASALIVVLQVLSSVGGLLIDHLYQDPPWASATFRGGNLVTLVVAAPVLVTALILAMRGSRRAQLVWVGVLIYSVYDSAYYVFGAAFNEFFLIHVALLSLSVFTLIFGLANLDVAGIGERFTTRTPARWISAYLLLVAAVLGGMWVWSSLRFALTGELPAGGIPVAGVHLVYALDLTLLAPSLTVGAVLLWRRTAWGYLMGAALCVMGAIYQLNMLVASAFQANAQVPGAHAFPPNALLLGLVFLIAAVLLLHGLRPAIRQASDAGTKRSTP